MSAHNAENEGDEGYTTTQLDANEDEAAAHQQQLAEQQQASQQDLELTLGWSPLRCSGAVPPAERQWTCATHVESKIYLFGGCTKRGNGQRYFSDLFCFDSGTRIFSF